MEYLELKVQKWFTIVKKITHIGKNLELNDICNIWHFELGRISVDLYLKGVFARQQKFLIYLDVLHSKKKFEEPLK